MSHSMATDPKSHIILSIKEWLSTCDKLHNNTCCNPNLNIISSAPSSSRPSWLIDTQNRCIVRGDVKDDYLALSYTWQDALPGFDDKQQLQLLSTNVDLLTRTNSLHLASHLPKVILDAMEFTTTIGKRYLWVDRLCIIQDDPRKSLEFMRMDQVYSNAYLTIIAAADCGMFQTSDQSISSMTEESTGASLLFSHMPYSLPLTNHDTIASAHYERLATSKWAQRAWTYQEHILSKRGIFFVSGLVFWLCESSMWDLYHIRLDRKQEASIASGSPQESLTRRLLVAPWPDFSVYCDLICPYNGRLLSHQEDGLSACLGILSRLEPSFPNGFIFGLPRLYLDYALLWQPLRGNIHLKPHHQETKELKRRPALPSWAWCGWECYVDPRSFEPALNLCYDSDQKSKASSWKLRNTITWKCETPINEPARLDELLQASGCQPLREPPPGWLSQCVAPSTMPPPRISTCTARGFFSPVATLAIKIIRTYDKDSPSCGYTLHCDASKNPVLTDRPLDSMPRVVVLQNSDGVFSGLLRVTGDSVYKPNEPIELIEISRGSVRGRDLKDCYETRVFQASKYWHSKLVFAHFDSSWGWKNGRILAESSEECKDFRRGHFNKCRTSLDASLKDVRGWFGVVASAEQEAQFKRPKNDYEDDRVYEFSNVLWVQRGENDVAYRAGCGRVFKDCWESNNPENITITLG